jgi:hypothetical protein
VRSGRSRCGSPSESRCGSRSQSRSGSRFRSPSTAPGCGDRRRWEPVDKGVHRCRLLPCGPLWLRGTSGLRDRRPCRSRSRWARVRRTGRVATGLGVFPVGTPFVRDCVSVWCSHGEHTVANTTSHHLMGLARPGQAVPLPLQSSLHTPLQSSLQSSLQCRVPGIRDQCRSGPVCRHARHPDNPLRPVGSRGLCFAGRCASTEANPPPGGAGRTRVWWPVQCNPGCGGTGHHGRRIPVTRPVAAPGPRREQGESRATGGALIFA